MFAYAVRRIVLVLPTLIGISLIAFALTALVPDPLVNSRLSEDSGVSTTELRLELEEERRSRFLDLPRFFNDAPDDIRSRARGAIGDIAKGRSADEASRRLSMLGGAAVHEFVEMIPLLPPEAANRVAAALAPVAVRMGLGQDTELARFSTTRFWSRFWENRALDFSATSIDRSIDRLVRHGTELREKDVLVEDTAALPALMLALEQSEDRATLSLISRIANHITGRGYVVTANDSERQVRHHIADWREWWFVHKTDFVRVEGFDRLIATFTDTRYGRWMLRVLTKNFGVNRDTGEPIADELARTIPVTLFMTTVAMLFSLAIAVPVGVVSAWRHGKTVDLALGGVLFALHSLPTFWVAMLLRRAVVSANGTWQGASVAGMVLPIVAVAATSVAVLSRAERASMLDVLAEDWIRTARAKGVSEFRALVVHALRNAVLPTISLAGLLFPTLLGASFVVEAVFGLPGLGQATLNAVARHDHAWVMASVVFAGTASAFGLVASDIAAAIADPRVRDLLVNPGRGLR